MTGLTLILNCSSVDETVHASDNEGDGECLEDGLDEDVEGLDMIDENYGIDNDKEEIKRKV